MASVVASGLLAGACGGGQEAAPPPAPEAPALPQALADELASRADEIAAAYDRGEACDADRQADALEETTIAAIASGEVPSAMQEELESTVTFLAGAIKCEEEPEDRGKGRGDGKGKGNGGRGNG